MQLMQKMMQIKLQIQGWISKQIKLSISMQPMIQIYIIDEMSNKFTQNHMGNSCCQFKTCIQCEVTNIEQQVFEYLGLASNYQINSIPIANGETIKTYYIESKADVDDFIYLGHGFGGTSLMYFPLIQQLLQKGNLVLWQIRGMGLNVNKFDYSSIKQQETQKFYNQGLSKILSFYNHKNITFISHSFGAFITWRYLIKCNKEFHANIKECILLSPIGITTQQMDYKNRCKGYTDIFHYVVSWIAWKYNLTYNSILRNIHGYVKYKLLKGWLGKFELQQQQLSMMIKIFDTLTNIRGNSSKCFYKTFLPRVLPTKGNSIQQLLQQYCFDLKTSIYYGGKSDWVDKQGAQILSSEYENIHVKKFQNCGHLLPLHVETMRFALSADISKII